MKSLFLGLIITAACLLLPLRLFYGQERSAPATAVTGGIAVDVAVGYDAAYDGVITFLKKHDYVIDTANKEIGQITTAVTGKEGWKGSRSWVQVTLTKTDESHTNVKVAVANQNRSHTIMANRGEYHAPKVNPDESRRVADDLKAALTPGSGS